MSFPKEPRQLMINMMYLVLTALLALNVSAEILNAFHVVNDGITNSNAAVDRKNELTMSAFEEQNQKDPVRTHDMLAKAKKARQLVDALNKQIQQYMDVVVAESGGWIDKNGNKQTKNWAPEKGNLFDDQDLDVSSRVMVDEGRAAKLKKAIEDTRTQLLALVTDPAERKVKAQQLPMHIDVPRKNNEGELKNWEATNFEMVPTIACLTLLNKFQNDAKNSQAQIVDYLFGTIYASIDKVDRLEARVLAPTQYVMTGQDYTADILLSAYSTSIVPKVYVGPLTGVQKDKDGKYLKVKQNPIVGGGKDLEVIGGIGKYIARVTSEGMQAYTGAIMVQGPDGTPDYYPFESSFISAKGSAVISPVNLNLIYAGLDNPFSVSVPGFDASKVLVSASEGTFTGTNGRYIANVPGNLVGKTIKINVSVKSDGKTLPISSQEFKVKAVPPPIAKLADKTQGTIRTGELKATAGPSAVLENFYFQGVKFSITSFDFVLMPRMREPSITPNPGQTWSETVKAKIQAIRPGDNLLLRNIKARGPGGVMYDLNPISLDVK